MEFISEKINTNKLLNQLVLKVSDSKENVRRDLEKLFVLMSKAMHIKTVLTTLSS